MSRNASFVVEFRTFPQKQRESNFFIYTKLMHFYLETGSKLNVKLRVHISECCSRRSMDESANMVKLKWQYVVHIAPHNGKLMDKRRGDIEDGKLHCWRTYGICSRTLYSMVVRSGRWCESCQNFANYVYRDWLY